MYEKLAYDKLLMPLFVRVRSGLGDLIFNRLGGAGINLAQRGLI